MRLGIVLVCFILGGCSTTGMLQLSPTQPRMFLGGTATSTHSGVLTLLPSPECDSLDSKRRTWSAVSAAAAFLAGSGVLGAAETADNTQLALEISGAALGAFSAFSVYMANDYASSLQDRGCVGLDEQ